MSYAVCRMQKLKAFDLKGIQFHNQRERESKTNFDIDKSKSSLNYDFVNDGPIDYNERVKEIIDSQKVGDRKTRKDAVVVNELLVTSDKGFFDGLSPSEQSRFFQESFKLFSERYGKQNIAYATVHYDEKTPHLHIGVVPMHEGKLQGKNVFNRKELMWIQDNFPEHMKKLGFDLQRGEKGSTREHIESQIFKKHTLEESLEKLSQELSSGREEIKSITETLSEDVLVPFERKEVEKVKTGVMRYEERETGNYVLTPEQFELLEKKVRAARHVAKENERIQESAFYQENIKLKEQVVKLDNECKVLSEYTVSLMKEKKGLENTVSSLKAQIGDLSLEIGEVYKNIREYFKERTEGLDGFKIHMKAFVGGVRERLGNKTGEFEKKHQAEEDPKRTINRGWDMER